ncbi:MAG: SEC-C metal-binding domain-containing protein, partial [Planctomycetota bacterium]|nr:SEC-C metal-binding domain-containing protein [Planctomycetota bacterium]
EREADIILQAGRKGAVTVATNMAGRGTDIVLGGNPEALWREEIKKSGVDAESASARALRERLDEECGKEHDEIIDLGGLYVIATERHEARRIDNQLRGRCARQGDPGATKFFLCFDDDLMRIFARDWVKTMMEKLGLKHGERIESPMVSRAIAKTQKKVENRNFDIRKNLIEYDEVMDKQRKFIYGQRQEVLEKDGLRDKAIGMFEEVLDSVLERHASDKDKPVEFDEIESWLRHKCGAALELDGITDIEREELFDWIVARVEELYVKRQEHYGEEEWVKVQQYLLMETIDSKWKDHLHAMEVLKAGIGLRGYAQIDPKNEYKKEGFDKFEALKEAVADRVTDLVFKVELSSPDLEAPRQQMVPQHAPSDDPVMAQAMVEAMIAAGQAPPEVMEAVAQGASVSVEPSGTDASETGSAGKAEAQRGVKVGRNEPCPCGSGVKYKKCCYPAFG